MKNLKLIFGLAVLIATLTSCEEEVPPTKSSMEGVWQIVEAYDENDSSIIDRINFPITGFYLGSDNTMLSSGGPMFMYIVYGKNKYTEIASKIDQVFNYATLTFNGGEFFVGGGVVERFTAEMKLEGLPGQKALTELLDIMNIGQDYLDVVVYHKFIDVKVTFEDEGEEERNLMTWEFDDMTQAVYNTKDNQGNYVLWQGWPVNSFSRCKFVFRKSVKDLETLVKDAS